MLIKQFIKLKLNKADERLLKEFVSEDEVDLVIEGSKINFLLHDHKKKEKFYKLLSNNKIKQAWDNEIISSIIGRPIYNLELTKIQIVKIINKIYNKYKYSSLYVLENE
jgi:hypothetical protein